MRLTVTLPSKRASLENASIGTSYSVKFSTMSPCGNGKLCGVATLEAAIFFHGPRLCHVTRVGVTSSAGPYLVIRAAVTVRASSGQSLMTVFASIVAVLVMLPFPAFFNWCCYSVDDRNRLATTGICTRQQRMLLHTVRRCIKIAA